jgi:hypothetical protein
VGAKTCVTLDSGRYISCYLFKVREILVKYDNTTSGTIPVTLLGIEARDEWEDLVDDSSSVR